MRRRIKITLISIVSVYVVVFASVNMAGLKVGFDYDDTLAFSTASFKAGEKSGNRYGTEEYWKVVNNSFSQDKKKLVTVGIAVVHKILGFDVVIITARKGYGGEELKKNWKWLAKEFYFEKNKSSILEKARFVTFFGDSDSDITEAQEAGVRGIRVKRSPKSDYQGKYHPGQYQEFIVPFSD